MAGRAREAGGCGQGRAARELRERGRCTKPRISPPPPPGNVPSPARRRGRSPLPPRPRGLAGGRGPRRGAGWGRLYQARIPCNVEIPAFPCGMGVCTEFKSPTLKFMKLLPGAEGCTVCMAG